MVMSWFVADTRVTAELSVRAVAKLNTSYSVNLQQEQSCFIYGRLC